MSYPRIKFWIGRDPKLFKNVVKIWKEKHGLKIENFPDHFGKIIDFIYCDGGEDNKINVFSDLNLKNKMTTKQLFDLNESYEEFVLEKNCKCDTKMDRFHLQWCPANQWSN